MLQRHGLGILYLVKDDLVVGYAISARANQA